MEDYEFDEIHQGELGMCGCGNPKDVQKFIEELISYQIKIHTGDSDYGGILGERRNFIRNTDPDIIFEYIFHTLEKADIVEHGGSVYGSWLTEKGERYYHKLKELNNGTKEVIL